MPLLSDWLCLNFKMSFLKLVCEGSSEGGRVFEVESGYWPECMHHTGIPSSYQQHPNCFRDTMAATKIKCRNLDKHIFQLTRSELNESLPDEELIKDTHPPLSCSCHWDDEVWHCLYWNLHAPWMQRSKWRGRGSELFAVSNMIVEAWEDSI